MSITLEELKGNAPETEETTAEAKGTVVETASGEKVRTFSPDEIGAPKKIENSIAQNMARELDVLDVGIQKNKEKLYEQYVIPQLEEAAEAELLGDDVEESASEPVVSGQVDTIDPDSFAMEVEEEVEVKTMADYKVSETVAVSAPEVSTTAPQIEAIKEDLGKDFFDVDIDDEDTVLEDDSTDEELEQVKAEIKNNIKPINNVIDLTKFTIAKKPASSAALLKSVEEVKKAADWVLFAAKKAITMTSLNGVELDHFNPRNISNSRNRLNTYKQLYTIMYKHLEDENKPSTLEAWTKTIPFYDINNLYFAVYRACYADNNIIPYTCPHCNKTFMANVDINKMVKFEKPEVESEFWKLYNRDTTSAGVYKAELVQISDNFVAAIKLPTVFSVVFENAALDEAFLNKYADLLGLITYIDAIYLINRESGQLEEVVIKAEANDFVKTTKRKVATFAKILCSLNSDQYNNFVAKMQDLMDSNDGISYIQPAAKCTHCEGDIPETQVEPLDMVFTRHQLGAISNL